MSVQSGVFVGESFDNMAGDVLSFLPGSHDCVVRGGQLANVNGIHGSTNIVFQGVDIGGTPAKPVVGQCQIGAAYKGTAAKPVAVQPCKNISFVGCNFHDLTRAIATEHHQALWLGEIDGLLLDGCTFTGIDGNTADIFFTGGVQIPGFMCTNVIVRNCHFGAPVGSAQFGRGGYFGINFNCSGGAFKNFLFDNNLFDQGAGPNYLDAVTFTRNNVQIKQPASNFVATRSFGSGSKAQYDAGVSGGIAADWPLGAASAWTLGASAPPVVTPPPVVVPPVVPPVDPRDQQILDLTADLAAETAKETADQALLSDLQAQLVALQAELDAETLQDGTDQATISSQQTQLAALQARIDAAKADLG